MKTLIIAINIVFLAGCVKEPGIVHEPERVAVCTLFDFSKPSRLDTPESALTLDRNRKLMLDFCDETTVLQ